MTEILQIFSGNPLGTFIGKRIEAATRPELESDDWALNLEICDMINENDDDAKDAVRAIRKRLQQIEQDRDFTVTNRTLTVLETCVSNCSRRFHVLIMGKDFIQDLVKLIGPKNNPPIELQERVLRLIERWAIEFKNQPDLNGVVTVYNNLKAKGVTFPPRDSNSAVPIQTPQRTVPSPATSIIPQAAIGVETTRLSSARPGQQQSATIPAQQHPQPAGPVVLEGEGYSKISQDLSVVQTSVDMFQDILKVLEAPGVEESDWKLAADLNTTCRQMKDRIVDLIERVSNEDLTIELLRLNDDLNNIFISYDILVRDKSKESSSESRSETLLESSSRSALKPTTSTSVATATATRSGTEGGNELSLIDFNVEDGPDGKQVSPSSGDSRPVVNDPFSTIVTESKVSVPSKSAGINTSDPESSSAAKLAENMEKLNLHKTRLGTGIGSTSQSVANKLPEEISSVREQDFAEIENWLSTDSGRNLESIGGELPSVEPISIPNSEFDNFIASRALAGSSTASKQETQKQLDTEPSI